MEVFKIVRTSTTTWRESASIEAETLEQAIELAEELDQEEWTDETESDGGWSYSEDCTFFLVAYSGEYCRIHANDRQSALYQAQQDYQRPPAQRLLDWKESEHTDDSWDIVASSIQ